MKNKFKTLILLSLVAAIFGQCKKGKDDPFMSIHTRKARLVGEWKLTKGLTTSTSIPYTGNNSSSTTENLTETTFAISSLSGSSSGTYSYKIEIKKDGTFSSTEMKSYIGNNPYTVTTTKSGTWNFTGRVGDYKNKEQVVFSTLSENIITQFSNSTTNTTYTYTKNNVDNSGSWLLKELRNKKIVVTDNYESYTSSSQITYSREITLEQ